MHEIGLSTQGAYATVLNRKGANIIKKLRSKTHEKKQSQGVDLQHELWALIEEEISKGKLQPGDRLDPKDLGKRFNVSRTPIREALLQLAALGLVAFRPRQGIIVTKLSVQQVLAMTEILPALESLCAELSARRMSTEERKRLKIISDEAVACAEAGDLDGYEKANQRVQQAIRLGSHNRYLIERIWDIRKRIHPYWPPGIRYFSTMVMERLTKEQQEVVDAILAGNDDRAREAMRSHLIYRAGHFMDTIASFGSYEDHADKNASFRAHEAN